jgi:hypothetical protein
MPSGSAQRLSQLSYGGSGTIKLVIANIALGVGEFVIAHGFLPNVTGTSATYAQSGGRIT